MLRHLSAVLALSWASHANAAWEYTGKTDPFSDERVSSAALFKSGVRSSSLIIRCKDGLLESYTNPGEYIGGDEAEVRIRFDKLPPETYTWSVSTEGTAAFASFPVDFARYVVSHASVAIEVRDFEGTPHVETFSLAGASGPVSRVLGDCGLMAEDPLVVDARVLPRVVYDVDALDVSTAKRLALLVQKLSLGTVAIGDRRSAAFYAELSSFYRLYWEACRARAKLSKSCTDYLGMIGKRDDYPKEVVDLLIEYAPSAGGDKVKFWSPLLQDP